MNIKRLLILLVAATLIVGYCSNRDRGEQEPIEATAQKGEVQAELTEESLTAVAQSYISRRSVDRDKSIASHGIFNLFNPIFIYSSYGSALVIVKERWAISEDIIAQKSALEQESTEQSQKSSQEVEEESEKSENGLSFWGKLSIRAEVILESEEEYKELFSAPELTEAQSGAIFFSSIFLFIAIVLLFSARMFRRANLIDKYLEKFAQESKEREERLKAKENKSEK